MLLFFYITFIVIAMLNFHRVKCYYYINISVTLQLYIYIYIYPVYRTSKKKKHLQLKRIYFVYQPI